MTIGTLTRRESSAHESAGPSFTSPKASRFPPNCPTGLTSSGIVRILPILQVDVRMAHPVVGSTMT